MVSSRQQFEDMKALILAEINETNEAIQREEQRHRDQMVSLRATLKSQQDNLAELRADLMGGCSALGCPEDRAASERYCSKHALVDAF
jgi:NTP pyrophosphatase (non-canonical NTP hydrolase)